MTTYAIPLQGRVSSVQSSMTFVSVVTTPGTYAVSGYPGSVSSALMGGGPDNPGSPGMVPPQITVEVIIPGGAQPGVEYGVTVTYSPGDPRLDGVYSSQFEAGPGLVIVPVPGCTNPAATNYNASATVDDGSCVFAVHGCTNRAALNYNPSATVDDGSCVLPVRGCTNRAATNYNPLATVDDGSCTFAAAPGCTNPAALNYNPAATSDNGSCILPVRGCTNPAALNYNKNANVDDMSCVLPVPGCTVPGAVNFNPGANQDNGSCRFPLASSPATDTSDACCNWAGDLLAGAAWASDDGCQETVVVVTPSTAEIIAAQEAQIAALTEQVAALLHIDEGTL